MRLVSDRSRAIGVLCYLLATAALGQAPPAARAQAHDDTATAARKRSPLSGKHRLPAGVRRQLRAAVGVGEPPRCYDGATVSAPVLTFFSWRYRTIEVWQGGRLEPATRGFFCAYGFAVRRGAPPLRWRVTRPDGKTQVMPGAIDLVQGAALSQWLALPGDPLGRYVVRASQGQRSAETSFDVVPPERPQLVVIDDHQSFVPVQRRGRPLTVAVAGLPAGGRAWLDFYRARNLGEEFPRFMYFNSVTTRADGQGMLRYRLRTTQRDRPGVYQVAVRRGRRTLASGCFTVTRRGGEPGACPSS